MHAPAFLTTLQTATEQLRATAQTEFGSLISADLNRKPSPTGWSVLECLEHLNRYSRYYNAQLAKALAKPGSPSQEVGYSWMGRKSVDLMHPRNTKKQTTLKRMNPHGSQLGPEVLREFVVHQTQLLELLALAHRADLNRKVVPIEFLPLLKMRVGEALEFVVVHQQRHMQQAQRAARQKEVLVA